MATDKRTADVVLRYKVDQNSANQVSSNLNELVAEIDDLQSKLRAAGQSGAAGITALTRELPRAESGIESLQGEVLRLRAELEKLDNVTVTPTVDVQTKGGGSLTGGLDVVDRIGTVGSQIGSGLGSGMVGNAAGLLGDIAGAAATMNPVLIASAVAIGGVSLVMQDLQTKAEAAKAAMAAQIEGERAAAQQAHDAAASQRERMAAIKQEIAFEELSIAARNSEIAFNNEYYSGLAEMARNAEIGTVTLVNAGNDLTASSDAARASIEESTTAISGLTAEYLQLNEQVIKLEADQQALLTVYNLLSGAAQALVDPIQQSAAELLNTVRAGQAFVPFIQHYADGIAKLGEQAQAQMMALRADKAEQYLNAITRTVQAQEALSKAQTAYNDAVAASEQRMGEINRKLQEDLQDAADTRRAELIEAEEKAAADRIRITTEAEKERARILKRFERSYSDAVGNRDTLAAQRAKQQRDDELAQLDERYADQEKAINDALAAQQKVIQARYDAQVKTVRAAADASVRSEQQAAAARLSALQQGLQAAQTTLINAQQSEYLIRANFYNQSLSQAQVWANLMQLYTSYGFSLPTGGGGSAGGGGGATPRLPTPLADGGTMYRGGVYLTGERGPELIVPVQPGRVYPSGSAFTINVEGAQLGTIRATSRQQALATFGRVLDQLGVA